MSCQGAVEESGPGAWGQGIPYPGLGKRQLEAGKDSSW